MPIRVSQVHVAAHPDEIFVGVLPYLQEAEQRISMNASS